MLKNVFNRLFDMVSGRKLPAPPSSVSVNNAPLLTRLNQHAPLVPAPVNYTEQETTISTDETESTDTFLCREAVLERNQRIAGYQFMLQSSRLSQIRVTSRRIHHFCARALVDTLAGFGLDRLLGHRRAFLDLPDSFLTDPSLLRLPPANTVCIVTSLSEPGAPAAAELYGTVAQLRQRGYLIAIPDPTIVTEFAHLLPLANIIMVRTTANAPMNTAHMLQLQKYLKHQAPHAAMLVRDLPAQEDFNFCYKLGISFFQGPFITRRENWHDNRLSPSQAHLTMLLARLRNNADTDEIVELIKHEPTLSLRLLRYINSAANGLSGDISSIKHAFILLGRERLLRWLILLLYTLEDRAERSAVLENALIRARMMETLAYRRPAAEQEELFLTGLLSLIDVILEIPLEKALTSLSVPEAISQAVLHLQGPYAGLLELAIACEKNDMLHAHKIAAQCDIRLSEASKHHLDALTWAMAVNDQDAEAQH